LFSLVLGPMSLQVTFEFLYRHSVHTGRTQKKTRLTAG